jgi:predicted ferric reductase
MDIIYYFHRYLAYALLAVVVAHPAILIAVQPSLAASLNPLPPPWPITAGVASLALLVAIVVTSAGRTLLRLSYETWKHIHLALAVSAVLLAFVHMRAIGYYSGTAASSVLWSVIGLSLAAAVVWLRIVRPWKLLRRPYRIAEVRRLPGDVWSLTVEPAGHAGFDFQPGQFAWLIARSSPLAMKEHPFSIASSPRPDGRLTFAIKERGDFTRLIGQFQSGETVYVDGPYGVFSIDHQPPAAAYVFIAGGIGLAPMMGMLHALADRGDGGRHVLIAAHGALDRIAFREELNALRKRLNLEVVYVLENPPEGWTGETGWITRELLERRLPENRESCRYFICGPAPMIRLAERCLQELGVPNRQVHTELFDLV